MGKGSRNRAEKERRRKARQMRKRPSTAPLGDDAPEPIKVPVWEYQTPAVEMAQLATLLTEIGGGEPLSVDEAFDLLMWTPITTVTDGLVEDVAPMQMALDRNLTRDEFIDLMHRMYESGGVQWDPTTLRYHFIEALPQT